MNAYHQDVMFNRLLPFSRQWNTPASFGLYWHCDLHRVSKPKVECSSLFIDTSNEL